MGHLDWYKLMTSLQFSSQSLGVLQACSRYLAQGSKLLPLSAMGSLPPDTRCVYCAVNLAGYIPDGCCGPTCMDCLFDCDEEQLILRRLGRYAKSFLMIGRISPVINCPAVAILRDHHIACCIASFLIPV